MRSPWRSFFRDQPRRILHVASVNNHRVLRFDGTTGAPLDTLVQAQLAGVGAPTHLIITPALD